MAEFLLHTLSELVRFAQKTTGPGWLWALAFVIHITVRICAIVTTISALFLPVRLNAAFPVIFPGILPG